MTTDIEHLTVEANGLEFHVAAAGPRDAPPLLLLHGFPEGWMSWHAVMRALPAFRTYAPDLRGYPGTTRPADGYDVLTLTDDVRGLIEALALDRPLLVSHDWGGALGWIFAHRYAQQIRGLVVVNCPHPRTLVRAVLHFDDFQTLRIPWVPVFEIPRLPEFLLTTALGRRFLRHSYTSREGQPGAVDRVVVAELVSRFRRSEDMRGPIEYYRQMVHTLVVPRLRRELYEIYGTPIGVPITLIWGEQDRALSAGVAQKSGADAGRDIDWRPLPDVGHFVSLEAPEQLASEISRANGAA